ncbi:hypothetical protein Val02_43520 [Virgisporangium aliadipatigenens]|uniref:DUF1800 domain-containing protein n=1 Tax=Virgisporangium aliadipatigenens TaxID=741659 RepID=A0A8J3YPC1_9ACTN|nr:DUF1800 domain-containing protein [Virgisporangium aliadipatigenens]GIJ47466.1 hypothetical protein Val02_43520 [Virgisporangium aliadipatigenens]
MRSPHAVPTPAVGASGHAGPAIPAQAAPHATSPARAVAPAARRPGRRGLLKAVAAIGAAGTGLAIAEPAAAAPAATAAPKAAADTTADAALQLLLRRATYGPTVDSMAELKSLGVAAWLQRQLNPAQIDDAPGDAVVKRFPLIALDITGVRKAVEAGTHKKYGWETMSQLATAHVARAAWSRRQLFEVMVDFWSNHLNVTCPSGDVWDSRQDYDRTVIRAFALGRFADMLKASARHPAMLSYLDNRSSTKAKPNENYARELMELHSVGLVYTEADVQAAARLLTGLTVDNKTGLYRFDALQHATGAVKVLTFSHANGTAAGGEAAALAFVEYLAMQPATAKRLAYKLCVRFVADEPPAALVEKLAKVYLDNRSAIGPVLTALFTSPEFAASAGQKVRTPFEDIVASVRALGLGPDTDGGFAGIRALYWMCESAGQPPLGWHPPNGYPDVAAAWASPSGYVERWNSHLNLAAGWWPKQLSRPASLPAFLLPGTLPATYGPMLDALHRRVTGAAPRPQDVTALATFLGKTPTSALKPTDAAVTSKFPYLVALLLDAPSFLVR